MASDQFPDLSARQLQTVVAVAEYSSFIAAAAALKTSQPRVTRTVKHVEEVLGVRLFDRSTRAVEITVAGREFVGVATRMLSELQLTVKSMQEIAGQRRGQVIIATIMSAANGRLPSLISQYRVNYPGIEVHVHEGVHGFVVEEIRSGAADFGITYLDHLPASFSATALEKEEFGVLVPSAHAFASRKTIKLSELTDVALVSLPTDSRTRRLADAMASAQGVALNHVATVTQFATMLAFVRADIGLAIAPTAGVANLLGAEIRHLPLEGWPVVRDLGAVSHSDRELSPAANGLLELICASWRS